MKPLAILTALSLSLVACATDDDSRTEGGRPPLGKPQIDPQKDSADITESFDLGDVSGPPIKDYDDGRLEWAETFDNLTLLHRFNDKLGVDEISVLDETGDVHCCVLPRGQLTELPHAGLK